MNQCQFCNKKYLRKGDLRRHYVKCSILENINIVGANNDIFILLKTLLETNKRMDIRIKKLEILAYKEKKKIRVLDWLNDNRKDSITYVRFLHNIEIGDSELETIYEHGILEGLTKILRDELKGMDEKPIMCFERKAYVLYVKTENGWSILESKEFKKNMCYLQRKILEKFREKNMIEQLKTDSGHNIYNKRLLKICNNNFAVKMNQINNSLYRNMKININKIINYTFEF